jgi:hypothetical protein
MLFSSGEFWLYEQQKGVPLSFMSGKWKDNGSAEVISSFLEKTLNRYRDIANLCQALHVTAFDPIVTQERVRGFLGQGAFGKVIRVFSASASTSMISSTSSNIQAMKFMEDTNVSHLLKEHTLLKNHAIACGYGLIAKTVSDVVQASGLCGFVLIPVGQACTREMVFVNHRPTLKEVLMALRNLHVQSPRRIIDGDPRLPDFIVHGKTLTWIDLMETYDSEETSALAVIADMKVLATYLATSLQTRYNEGFEELMRSYVASCNEDSINVLESFLRNRWMQSL